MSRNNKEANIQAGLDKNSIPPVPVLSRAPSDYTWHHMEDGKTMMLVDKKVHA
ncbi:HNH endonuclease [Listeria booriae]|nr:HNH endonuclease [Listeria booriae]MBC2169193.1 HNH endonuclease [Listeria booriae]